MYFYTEMYFIKFWIFMNNLFGFFIIPICVEMKWFKDSFGEARQILVNGCNSAVRLRPQINANELFSGNKDSIIRLRLSASFTLTYTGKGCSRDTYDTVELYQSCGVEKPVQLLPLLISKPDVFIQNVEREVTSKGGLDYVFDGGTAVRYPTANLPTNWYERYTVSGWIFGQVYDERQYIISWSDGDTVRHDNMGFYMGRRPTSNHITFGFHHMHQNNGMDCMLKLKWRLAERNLQWNFFTLSFQECSVELIVNGKRLEPLTTRLAFHLPEKHIQPKFVIGARWAGSVLKYSDYFHGKISGLMLKAGFITNEDTNQCLYACKERIDYADTLPDDITETENNSGTNVTIKGNINKEDFVHLLNSIVYTNKDEMADTTKRTITFDIEDQFSRTKIVDDLNLNMFKQRSNLSISGDCSGDRDAPLYFKQGIRLCDNLQVSIESCVQTIDAMVVNISPNPVQGEKIYIAPPYLKRHHLSLVTTATGFIVYGIATVSQYTEVMYHIKYAFSALLMKDITRKITLTVSSRNGLIRSNEYHLYVHASRHMVTVSQTEYVHNSDEAVVVMPIDQHYDNRIPVLLKKKVALKTNKSNGHHPVVLVLACTFSGVLLAAMFSYGVFKWKNRQDSNNGVSENHEEQSSQVPTEYFWEEEGLPMRLTINPTERVSITNDPYTEILLQKKFNEDATTDGSVYSDDDMTEFDTDSIRQLEWDCLESSVEAILQEQKERIGSSSDAKTTIV